MDKDRALGLKRSGGGGGGGGGVARTFAASSPAAKGHQRALSGHITIDSVSKPHPSPSSSPSDLSGSSSGREGRDAMEVWEKEKPRDLRLASSNKEEEEDSGGGDNGVRGSESTEEEGCLIRSPPAATTTASLSSRKRVRLQGKVTENCSPVDPALVPRKLRSAVNKRNHQPASPPLPGSKKKRIAPNGIQPSLVSSARRFKQSILIEPTEEEKEVAEALFSLSTLIPVSQPVEKDRILSEELSDTKKTSVSPPEAACKQGDKKLLAPSSGAEVTKHSSRAEKRSQKSSKAELSVREQAVIISGSPNIDWESNRIQQSVLDASLKSEHDHADTTCLVEARKSLNPQGPCRQLYYGNGTLQTTQLDALPSCKLESGIWPLASAPGEQEPQSGKQRPDSSAPFLCKREATSDMQQDNGHGYSLMPSSSKAVVQPDFGTDACRPNTTENGQLAEKLPPVLAAKKWSSKRCTTHVYISHLIENHKKIEKKRQLPYLSDQSKIKEGKNTGVFSSNETNGSRNCLYKMTSVGANGHDARTQMLQDGRYLRAQESSMLSGTYSQQKPVYDFLSLSTTNETSGSANGVKSPAQIHVPYLHPQVPHHSISPYPFPHGPSPYPDQLAAAANQQMLHLPHYMGNPFYGQHMVHAGGPIKQQQQYQQQIWQAQMGHYRSPASVLKWPIEEMQNETSSLFAFAQPPSNFPPPSSEMLGGAYHLPTQMPHRQLLPIPTLYSSSRSKQQQRQPHDGSRLLPEVPAQLQLLCNTQRT